MGQPVSLELTPRRRERRARPVEPCLPCTCHIPSCKRTVRLFRSHCRSGGSTFASAKKPGTPPGIRTRKSMFLRHARIPLPPAGHENKKPGHLTAQSGLWKIKSPERFRGPGLGGSQRVGASFPPVPDACGPRRVPGDPVRSSPRPLAGIGIAHPSISVGVSCVPQRKRVRILHA